ncbi:hypothetical protein P3X46_001845 [Hevea brasiliensis]|uniref:Uncharacterized protein n=1 Tax=Hevea brasiliensis TaxID=3981 RepID=A0ABQ9NFM9_HEVBR|nr:hypothetical protein P3X46_001845 [Hevea brasiliensis]
MGEVKSRVVEKRAEKKRRSEKKLTENVASEQDKGGCEERKESKENIPRVLEKGESSTQKESCAERGERKLSLYAKGRDVRNAMNMRMYYLRRCQLDYHLFVRLSTILILYLEQLFPTVQPIELTLKKPKNYKGKLRNC